MVNYREEIIDDYYTKRQEDVMKEEVLQYVMTADALEKVRFVKIADVDLYDRFLNTVFNMFQMKALGKNSIGIQKFREIMGEVRKYRAMSERLSIGRQVA